MIGMAERGMWLGDLRRAAAESCAPQRNWRWMLASLGIGAGFGLIGGLYRLGDAPATITSEVALASVRVALFFLVVAWLVATAVRLGRSLWARNG
jgi:hypothetical protein